jgi:hypothetical protein
MKSIALLILLLASFVILNAANGETDERMMQTSIITKIQQLQRQHVKLSYSITNCYTDVDFKKFQRDGITGQITRQLRTDRGFLNIVSSLNRMSPDALTAILDSATNTYKKTWAALGFDPATTPRQELLKGQTDAGSEAERLIAEAVVNLVHEMLRTRSN